jgi:predicted alpha/beta hydrolase family esterase
MSTESSSIKLLPGWQNSGPGHWQTVWEQQLGYERVQQHDWLHPKRGDWTARLQDVVLDAPQPVVLVAHSLGCILAISMPNRGWATGRWARRCWPS